MKRWLLPAALALLAVGSVLWLQQRERATRTGFPAPDFALLDLQGHTHRLSDFRGRVVFLNLWATWCPPCRLEMPAMEALYQQLKGHDFVMLAVSEDVDGAEAVGPFVADLGLSFPILLDPAGRLPPRYGVTGYPETFVIDRNGHVIEHIVGPAEWQREDIVARFRALLAAPTATVPAVANQGRAG
jgi:peroxiredoxin